MFKNKNYKQSVLLSTVILLFGYLLIRFALFDIHKMKDWPRVLFMGCLVILIISLFTKKRIIPLVTSVSYIIGFIVGFVFQTNSTDQGVGTTNNLWIIWTISILLLVLGSIIFECFMSRKLNN